MAAGARSGRHQLYDAIEVRVPGLVDDPHATCAVLFKDLIMLSLYACTLADALSNKKTLEISADMRSRDRAGVHFGAPAFQRTDD